MKKPITLTIEVSAEAHAALRVLDAGGDAQCTLVQLVERVMDGVTRPGAWERAWLEQAFGEAWHEHLVPDPSAPWRQRPRRVRARRRRA
jgi:hypothetical protein